MLDQEGQGAVSRRLGLGLFTAVMEGGGGAFGEARVAGAGCMRWAQSSRGGALGSVALAWTWPLLLRRCTGRVG